MKSRSVRMLAIALCIVFLSMIFSSAVQSSFGKVEVSELRLVDDAGYEVSVQLYKPKSATPENKAPAVITIEGWFNNKEMQDLFSVEYARRGMVVIATDMHGHGDSEATTSDDLYTAAVGVDAAVQLAGSLPYVDTTKIGVTGHSSGGAACDMAVAIDNERETPLISAVLFQASTWVDDTGEDHSADFNDRDVGIIADKYDEFFFWTEDAAGNPVSPRDFLMTDDAKNFVNFNNGPEGPDVVSGQYYENGDAFRVIYQMSSTHPWVHFSKRAVAFGVDFFEKAFGTPITIDKNNQAWQWKAFFNFIGLAGIVMFMMEFICVMVGKTKYFGILNADKMAEPVKIADKKGKTWFWIPVAVCAIFSPLCFFWCIVKIYGITTKWFTQNGPLLMGLWSAISAVFAIIVLIICYSAYGKKNGFSAKDSGLAISWKKLWRTIVLALFAVALGLILLFFADFFFKTDFRLWVLTLKAFEPDKVIIALKYLPLFLLFYVVNSISTNCFNYNTIGGEKGLGNAWLMGLMNVVGLIIFEIVQYVPFVSSGFLTWYSTEGFRICGIWLFPAIIYLFVTPFLTRFIYKRTKNPYLMAIVNACIITIMCVANTTTILGGAAVVASNY